MKKFLLFVALILSFAFDASANTADDATRGLICNIIKYIQGLGEPIITIMIIGAALVAIFGRMPWPALFALGAFTAVFLGAPKIVTTIAPGTVKTCTTQKKSDLLAK